MTTVTALGQMTAQASQEQTERYGGRPATLGVQPYDSRTGMPFPEGRWNAAIADLVERFQISQYAVIGYDMGLYRMPGGSSRSRRPGSARPTPNSTASSRSRAACSAKPTGRTSRRRSWSTRTS